MLICLSISFWYIIILVQLSSYYRKLCYDFVKHIQWNPVKIHLVWFVLPILLKGCQLTLSHSSDASDRAVSESSQIWFAGAVGGLRTTKMNLVGSSTSLRSPIKLGGSIRHRAIIVSSILFTWPTRRLATSQFRGSFFWSLLFGCHRNKTVRPMHHRKTWKN